MPYCIAAGVEQERRDHRVHLDAAHVDAGLRITSRSYLMLWPTFLIARLPGSA